MAEDAYGLLWGGGERRPRGRPASLSRDRIVAEAVAIADAEGLERVSMKRVAERLDSAAMSLYRHVPGKAELVALMYDATMAEPPLLRADQGWRTAMADWAHALRELFLAHPWALPMAPVNHAMGPGEVGWLDAAVASLAELGLSGEMTMSTVLAVDGYVLGALRPEFDDAEKEPEWFRFLADPAARERFPNVTRMFVENGPDTWRTDQFEFGLQRLLDGLERYFADRA